MTPHELPTVGLEPLVFIRIYYKPVSGRIQLEAGEASADQVLVALVKTLHLALAKTVHPQEDHGPPTR